MRERPKESNRGSVDFGDARLPGSFSDKGKNISLGGVSFDRVNVPERDLPELAAVVLMGILATDNSGWISFESVIVERILRKLGINLKGSDWRRPEGAKKMMRSKLSGDSRELVDRLRANRNLLLSVSEKLLEMGIFAGDDYDL